MQLLGLVLSLLLQAEELAPAKVVALRGARIYTGAGPVLDGGVILLEKGRIAAVGKDVPIPSTAEILDLSGKVVIPGLIDAASRLFLPSSGERSAGSAEQRALDALDFFQPEAAEAVQQGVTTIYAGPVSQGTVNGLGVIVHLDPSHTVLLQDAALKVTLGASGGESSSALERVQAYTQLKQTFEAARQYLEEGEKYRRDQAAYEQAQKDKKTTDQKPPAKPKTDPKLELVSRCLRPKEPLTLRIEVHTADAILSALRLVEEFKLKAVLEYVTEGREAVAAIAKANIPSVVGPVFRLGNSSVDYLHHSPVTASVLSQAGVPVAVASFGDERAGAQGPGSTRFLLEAAAFSSRGLSREQALDLVTLGAARILGIDRTLGSIEKGKIADLVLLSGEPFEPGTRVERTWIDGVAVFVRGAR